MDIGFIGVGSMGAAILPNLLAAGHRLSLWNRAPSAGSQSSRSTALDELRKHPGVSIVASPATLFAEQTLVISMLADDAAVREVLIDSNALAAARQGCVHVVMSTLSLALVEELQALHAQAGIAYVAAPVFGVPAVAAQGQLNILVAGEPQAVAAVEPILAAIGQKTWHLGSDQRHANIAKIAGNLMITLAIEAMGEATALTESYGLPAADFLEIVTNTMFACPSYKRYGANLAQDTYEPGFKLALGLKDVDLALHAAQATRTELPAARIVQDHLRQALEKGWGAQDWSALAKITRQRLP